MRSDVLRPLCLRDEHVKSQACGQACGICLQESRIVCNACREGRHGTLTRHCDEPARGLQTDKIQATVPGHDELGHGRVLQRNEILAHIILS